MVNQDDHDVQPQLHHQDLRRREASQKVKTMMSQRIKILAIKLLAAVISTAGALYLAVSLLNLLLVIADFFNFSDPLVVVMPFLFRLAMVGVSAVMTWVGIHLWNTTLIK